MILTDFLGYLGNLFFLFGAIWLAQKKIGGFCVQAVANIFYIIQSIILHNNPLLLLSIVLAIFNLYGVYKWRKK